MVGKFLVSKVKDAGYVINLSKDTFIKPVFKKIEEKKEEENKPTFDVSKRKITHK